MNKYKVGDFIIFNSFGKTKSMVINNVIDIGDGNPLYEDKNGNGVFEKDILPSKFCAVKNRYCHTCVKSTLFHHYCKELKCWIKSPKKVRCRKWTDTKVLLGGVEYYMVYE